MHSNQLLSSIRKIIREELKASLKSYSDEVKIENIPGGKFFTKWLFDHHRIKLSHSHYYTLVHRSKIPFFREAGKVYHSRKAVEEWIRAGRPDWTKYKKSKMIAERLTDSN